MVRLSDDQVTTIIHRICLQGEPIKAVAMDLGIDKTTVGEWVYRYEGDADEAAAFVAACKDAGLRQTDLGRLTGRRRGQVWRWFNGRSPIPGYAWTVVRQQQNLRRRGFTIDDIRGWASAR